MAAGVFGLVMTQVTINVGMTLGIAPTTGIPLPFMTYGGSNTLTNLAAIGLALAIGARSVVDETPDATWQERPRRTFADPLEAPVDPI